LSPADLPGLETLLCQGGDARLACDPLSGLNAYGCPPRPRPGQLAFGSATASTISAPAFAAAQALRSRLASGALDAEAACAGLRQELAQLCGAPAGSGVVLGASGTDVHLIAAHWAASAGGAGPLLVLMPEAAETGSGVPAALRGLHPGGWSALGGVVPAGGALAGLGPVEAVELACRDDEGQPLPLAKRPRRAGASCWCWWTRPRPACWRPRRVARCGCAGAIPTMWRCWSTPASCA